MYSGRSEMQARRVDGLCRDDVDAVHPERAHPPCDRGCGVDCRSSSAFDTLFPTTFAHLVTDSNLNSLECLSVLKEIRNLLTVTLGGEWLLRT